MNGLKRILAATDFSEQAAQASYRAALLASEHHAQLDLLHVVSKPSLEALRELFGTLPNVPERVLDDVRYALQERAVELTEKTGIKVTSRVVVGQVLDEIPPWTSPTTR